MESSEFYFTLTFTRNAGKNMTQSDWFITGCLWQLCNGNTVVTETESHTHKRLLFILSQRSIENKKQKEIIKGIFYVAFIENEHTGEEETQASTTSVELKKLLKVKTHFIREVKQAQV